jgi:hypothetical protein
MVIGVLILAIGLLCIKRYEKDCVHSSFFKFSFKSRRRQHPPPPPPFGTFNPTGYKDDMNYKASTTCTAYSQPTFMTRTDTSGGENDYEYVDDVKFPPPPPHITGSTFGKPGTGCSAHGTGTLNQYGFNGTPNFTRMKTANPGVGLVQQFHVSGAPMVPQYYEVDPVKDTECKEAVCPRVVDETPAPRHNMNFGHYSQ